MSVLAYTVIVMSALGVLSAVLLWFVAGRFRVYEDPRIDDVERVLPGVNCGGCGFAGCRAFAVEAVKAEDISSVFCPVGGGDVMAAIGALLGKSAAEREPLVAVVRCNGSCENRPVLNAYDGASSCAVAAANGVVETGCSYGCLGKGDCVVSCAFDAIRMNAATGLPEVEGEKCTACGACVKACPKAIIELRRKGPRGMRIFVSCVSMDKGGVARKACTVACIGCGKCVKVCPFEAITLENNLAYIDYNKCRLCRKCAPECPTNAIREVGFPSGVRSTQAAEAIATAGETA